MGGAGDDDGDTGEKGSRESQVLWPPYRPRGLQPPRIVSCACCSPAPEVPETLTTRIQLAIRPPTTTTTTTTMTAASAGAAASGTASTKAKLPNKTLSAKYVLFLAHLCLVQLTHSA